MAKLILSLRNTECGFSIRECLESLDEARTAPALRMVTHFAAGGEDADLVAAGYEVRREYPRLWELGQTGEQAKRALRAAWETAGSAQT